MNPGLRCCDVQSICRWSTNRFPGFSISDLVEIRLKSRPPRSQQPYKSRSRSSHSGTWKKECGEKQRNRIPRIHDNRRRVVVHHGHGGTAVVRDLQEETSGRVDGSNTRGCARKGHGKFVFGLLLGTERLAHAV